MSSTEAPPYDVHLPYEGTTCGEFVYCKLIQPLTDAGYSTYTTKYYRPGKPVIDEFIKGLQQSKVTVVPLCQAFIESQYYYYIENGIHDRKIIREGSVIFVRVEEGCSPSQKLKPFGCLDFTTDAAYTEAFPLLLRTLGPPSSAPEPQRPLSMYYPDTADEGHDDVFTHIDTEEDQQMPRTTKYVHAVHRGFDAMGPQIHTDLVDPETALLTACKEFEWSEWSLKAFCQDPDSYIRRVQKITPPLKDDVEKVLLLGILPAQQTARGSCITLAKLSCCGLPRVEEQALEALLDVILQNMYHQGTDYAESGSLSDVAREVLYILSNREALRQWSRGTALLRMHVCSVLLICLHVSYVHGDIGLEFSAEELKKTQAVIKHKFETFEATDLSFRCLADFYIHMINEASNRIARKSVGKFKELLIQMRVASSTDDPRAAKQVVKDICRADEYEQQIVLSHLADLAHDSETALGMFQQTVYKLTQSCHGSRADRLFIAIAEQFVKILQTTKRSDLCCLALRPQPPTDGKRKKRLGLAELWYEPQFNQGNARQAVEVLCRPLLHHPQPTVRETMARRLAMRQAGDIEWEDLVPIEAKHISDQYKMLGLRILTHQPTPCHDIEGHVVWKGTTTHGNVAIKVYKLNSMQDLMGNGETSEGARIVRNNVRMLGELNACPNILQLLAFQLRPQPVFHITEYMDEGNLLEFLLRRREDHQHTRSSLLYLHTLITLLLDMVAALRFCHHHNIVHRDVIARNFLVSRKGGNYRCKLGNFNMAAKVNTLGEEETYECPDCLQLVFQGSSQDPVAKLWSAPESMMGYHYQFSDKSDVWMLGCAMYEVLTHGCRPYTEMWGMAADDIVQQVVFGLRPRQPSCVPRKLFQSAMLPCFLTDPAERIGLKQLERKLKSYLRDCPLPGVEHIDDIHPPPRLSPSQSARPERGIPRNLETQISSEPEFSSTGYKIEKEKFPCYASEILAYDQPNDNGEEFLQETKVDTQRRNMLLRLDHVHIRRVLDVVRNGDQVKQISQVFPGSYCMPLLDAARLKRLSVDDMVRCLSQVAEAMAFVHGQTLVRGEGIIHCDLRAMYVIWNGQLAKVGRWGRASRLRLGLYDTKLSESVVTKPMPSDALRWSPMEVIESGIYSQGSDIFTFGQLCWEVFHAYNADKGSENRMLAPYPDLKASEVLQYLQRRQRPLQPCDCPDWLYRLMKVCWLDERSRRPAFDKIVACFNNPHTSPLLDIGDNGTYRQQAPGGNEESLNAALNYQDRHYFRQGLLQPNPDNVRMHAIGAWNADNVSQSSVDTFNTATSGVSDQSDSTLPTSESWLSAESRSRSNTNSTITTESCQMSRSSTCPEDLHQMDSYGPLDLPSMSYATGAGAGPPEQDLVYQNSTDITPLVAELTSRLQDAQLAMTYTLNPDEDVGNDEVEEASSDVKLCRKTSFLNPSYGYNHSADPTSSSRMHASDRPSNPAVLGASSENAVEDNGGESGQDYYAKLNFHLSSHLRSDDKKQAELSARPPVPPRPSMNSLTQNGDGQATALAPLERPLSPRAFSPTDAEDDPPYADVCVRQKNKPPNNITRPLSMLDIYSTPNYRSSVEDSDWEQKSTSSSFSSKVLVPGENTLGSRVLSNSSLSSQCSSYLGSSQESISKTSKRKPSTKGAKGVWKSVKKSFRKKSGRAKNNVPHTEDSVGGAVRKGASCSDNNPHTPTGSESTVERNQGNTSPARDDHGHREGNTNDDSEIDEYDTRL